MHLIHGYISGITAVCYMFVMYHVKFISTCWFYINTIWYTYADNLMLIMSAGNSQLTLNLIELREKTK